MFKKVLLLKQQSEFFNIKFQTVCFPIEAFWTATYDQVKVDFERLDSPSVPATMHHDSSSFFVNNSD